MERNVTILGVDFTDMSFGDALERLAHGKTAAARQTFFFANAATLNIAARDPSYRGVLNGADVVFADGTGVRWAARLRGRRLQANLNGTDLIPAFIRQSPGLRVYLLGATQTVAEAAAAKFPILFPHAILTGWHHGYFDHNQSGTIVAAINRTRPDLLLVGFGNPLQERWIAANRGLIDSPLVAGIGGLFGFWAGSRTRAPRLLRRWGMEWVHILLSEGGKARRYLLGNPAFLARILIWLPFDRPPF